MMHKEILKLVFSDTKYLVVSISVTIIMLVLLFSAQGYLFIEPYFTFFIPQDMFPSFISIIIVSGLIGIVSSLAIYQISIRSNTKKSSTTLVTSFVGTGAGICVGCSVSLIIPIFAVLGIASALNFVIIYEFPIRLATILLLIGTYLMIIRGFSKECPIKRVN